MSQRKFLKNNILLQGESSGGTFERNFQIVRKIKEGASVVCYEACHDDSGMGILKEFYPQKALSLMRNKEGQLIHDQTLGNAAERFDEELQRYLRPYHLLLQALREPENRDLQTFIPAYEIYRGTDRDPASARTAYIWTTDPESVTFASICGEIRANPTQRPEYKLVTVLSAIVSLTECIRALHYAGFVHRDIKPGNFGFASRSSEALTQSISLFDIDSVCPMYPLPRDRVVSEGFTEPEALRDGDSDYAATCQTDIYSIGATLFSAIVLTEETERGGFIYRPEYKDRLRELIAGSKLITASQANAHPKLRSNLFRVLERCLCPRAERYINCDDLLEDLNKALRYALPSHIARTHVAGERWVLTDAEKSLDVAREENNALALHYHLFEKPLYAHCDADSPDMNVLIVGFGHYGQKFMDLGLAVGQMRGKNLTMTVVSDDEDDKKQYLSDRPELSDYFALEGPPDPKRHYGAIRFEPVRSLERENPRRNFDIMQDMVVGWDDAGEKLHYVFIALGEDELNRSAAEAVREAAQLFDMDCSINFVWEGEPMAEELPTGLNPVYVNADIRKSALHAEIERMAFNTHRVWEKGQNIPYRDIRAEFRKPYNHDSSVSNVLSLKYKLYSIGIDLDKMDYETAAREFSSRKKTWKNDLIWMEHRRWVTEKLCGGWRQLRDLEACPSGQTKDDRKKMHICIVRSDPNQNLASNFRANNYEKWDTATEAELKKLDDLDRLSVMLHRMYVRQAAQMRRQNLFGDSHLTSIRELIRQDKAAMVAFQEWYACLKEIWNGDYRKVSQYSGLKNALLGAVGSKQVKQTLTDHVKAFESVFYPILASVEHRDFKQDDVAMVDSIPRILTYREDICMAVPYAAGDNTQIFSNIAAAAVADPEKILFLCYLDERGAMARLRESLPYIARFMDKKKMRAAVELIIAYNDQASEEAARLTYAGVKQVIGTRLRQIKLMPVRQTVKLASELGAYLEKRRESWPVFLLEENKTNLSYLLQGADVYSRFAHYRFDSVTMQFGGLSGCDFLGYIHKKTGITVADMASLSQSAGRSSHPEFFSEYQALWERYRKNTSLWKMACSVLGDHSQRHDELAVFKKRTDRAGRMETEQYRYLVPFSCIGSVEKLLGALLDQGILEPGSCVNSYTTDSCEVLILDKWLNRRLFDDLFASHFALMDPAALDIHENTGRREVVVSFDDLVVKDLALPTDRRSELVDLMWFFAGLGFVTGLVIRDDTMRFTYATRQIKDLMTTAGKILEIYTYHKARELCKFDDVVSSYELSWENTRVLSEFDCILTRGFCSLFVECKARNQIEQDYYYKLTSLARQFGVNAKAVLIADTLERGGNQYTPVNDMQRQRGDMLDVITVWDPAEIQNIGKTLLEIMDGTYVPKM